MGEKVVLIVISLFFGCMPLWMGFVVNPRWAVRTRRTVIAALILLNVLFYGFLFFSSSVGTFADMLTSSTSIILLLVFWVMLIYRAYQLWTQ
jgi:hypothetical protein